VETLELELDREDDGRWLAEIPALPGVMAYGRTRDDAIKATQALALKVIGDSLEHGEAVPPAFKISLFFSRRTMSAWPITKAMRGFSALLRIGWSIKRSSASQLGSYRKLERPGYPEYIFAFHDDYEIGPKMLARLAKHTGLVPQDLSRLP
jgi:predicted RNase H-like HicB family nuclease